MDARNKITQDMLQPKVERSFSDEEGSSDYLFELSDNDSDISDMRFFLFRFLLKGSACHMQYLSLQIELPGKSSYLIIVLLCFL